MDKLILDMLHQNIQFPDKKDLNFIVYTGHKKMKLTLAPIRNNHKLKEQHIKYQKLLIKNKKIN